MKVLGPASLYEGLLVMAPSCSGKSTFVRRAYGPGTGIPLVDGDDVIAAHGLWPEKKNWWDDETGAKSVHRSHALAMACLFQRNRDVTVLFNSSLKTFLPVLMENAGCTVCVVIPPQERLHANYLAREKAIVAGFSGHSSRPWSHYLSGLEKFTSQAKELNLRTFRSFEEMATHYGIYVKKTAHAST